MDIWRQLPGDNINMNAFRAINQTISAYFTLVLFYIPVLPQAGKSLIYFESNLSSCSGTLDTVEIWQDKVC